MYRCSTQAFCFDPCTLFCHSNQHLPDSLAQPKRNSVANLPVTIVQSASDFPIIGELLDTHIFAHRERAILRWVTEHGCLLHRAGHQRRRWLIVVQSAIKANLAASTLIGATHRCRYEFGRQVMPVAPWRDHAEVAQAVKGKCSIWAWIEFYVLNCHAKRHPLMIGVLVTLKVRWNRQENILIVARTDDDQPLSKLWDAIMSSIKHTIDDSVAQIIEGILDDLESCSWLLI